MKLRIGASLTGLVVLLAACGQAQSDARPAAKASPVSSAAATPAASPQTGPAVATETKEFRDWTAVCNNGNDCYAFGFAPDYGAGWVRIFMPAGPNAEPQVAFGLWSEDFYKGASTGKGPPPLSLVIDGRVFPGVIAGASDEDAPVGEIRTGVRGLISALAAGRALEIRAGETQAISISGSSAALLWIDERQGRLGTTTALLRRGDRPASSVPPAATLPLVQAAPVADQTGFGEKQPLPAPLRAVPSVAACLEETADNEWLRDDVMSARLDARTELWAVPCGAGAYNVSHQWYVTGPGGRDPRPAELLGSGGPRTGDAAEVWPANSTINGGYAANARAIVAFSKGRGIGDCGTSQTWVWTGRRFELELEDSMGHCAGVAPDYWPTTWRTR
ncbi:MAG: DUF1176 domain-containing protein [Brevundimonas sp.]|nr:MAG: DUF1176 domain-containing protein [Brevundimonas sp.]